MYSQLHEHAVYSMDILSSIRGGYDVHENMTPTPLPRSFEFGLSIYYKHEPGSQLCRIRFCDLSKCRRDEQWEHKRCICKDL